MATDSEQAVPAHLRQYIVQQDYRQYTARDQAVWRFVLSQTRARLLHTAHPAYASGFEAAGIEVDRIPEIAQMSERLSRVGFRAVCVDGFIPPRAFQAFQACGVLPIAADIRTAAHLSYTPAPDVIHEAAGHAPFLAHPDYGRFLRKIGACSEHAFETPHDHAVYRAIFTLSELKENPESTPEQLAAAVARLSALQAEAHEPSEAARMARLYWWTVEYGLVGTPSDYRLYGAGLLSSIGEGHFCHDPKVQKRVFDVRCMDVDYDITQAQPQLFVARDFAHLHEVLEQAERTLSYARGGADALRAAAQSGEVACLTLDTGVQVAGTLRAYGDGWAELDGPCAVAREGVLLARLPQHFERYLLALGELEDGGALCSLSPAALSRHADASGLLALRTRAGLTIRGRLGELLVDQGRVSIAILHELTIARGDEIWLRTSAPYPFAFAQRVATASPALPDGYYEPTRYSTISVPKPRRFDEAERTLIALHEQVNAVLCERLGASAAERVAAMHELLARRFPNEWLLRWNLLAALLQLGERGALAQDLERELEQLELRFAHREPIATGLAYLRASVSAA